MKTVTRRLCTCAFLYLSAALTASADEVVKWPNLKKLDDLAEKCEGLSDARDIAGLRQVSAATKTAAIAVEKDEIPAAAKDKARVKTLLGDLKSVTDSLTDPKTQDGEELLGLLAGVHPIVEQLMEASGMPHVHEEPKKENTAAGTHDHE
jgi:hypothetical protein